jgi:hypothetical protein
VHVRGHRIELDVPPRTEFNVDGEVFELAHARFTVLGTIEVVAGPRAAGPKGSTALPRAA